MIKRERRGAAEIFCGRIQTKAAVAQGTAAHRKMCLRIFLAFGCLRRGSKCLFLIFERGASPDLWTDRQGSPTPCRLQIVASGAAISSCTLDSIILSTSSL